MQDEEFDGADKSMGAIQPLTKDKDGKGKEHDRAEDRRIIDEAATKLKEQDMITLPSAAIVSLIRFMHEEMEATIKDAEEAEATDGKDSPKAAHYWAQAYSQEGSIINICKLALYGK